MFATLQVRKCTVSDSPPFRGSAIPEVRYRVNPNPNLTLTPGMADLRNGGPESFYMDR